jgi:hypothetical protein
MKKLTKIFTSILLLLNINLFAAIEPLKTGSPAVLITGEQLGTADRVLAGGVCFVAGTVKTRSEAEELFLGIYQGDGYKNATGMSATETKNLFGEKVGTYHWDDTMDTSGRVSGHGIENTHGDLPHLQIHTIEGPIDRIFYGK